MHDHLRRAAAWRIRRVAIHPVLGDVDVEAAQIDCAKLVERVINLMKFERFVSRPAIPDHLIQSLENPAIDQCKILFPAFLLSCLEIKKIAEQNP